MISLFRKIAFKIRHNALLEHNEGLWNFLRKPYHNILNIASKKKGVKINIGNLIDIYLPAIYTSTQWQEYEPDTITFLINWIRKNPNALILDLGCSTGFFSTICLFADETSKVIAFDSDLESLQSTKNMAKFSIGNRLSLIYGFVSAQTNTGFKIDKAIAHTNKILLNAGLYGKPGTTKYINLDHHSTENIPTNSIDSLFDTEKINQTILIKCDVEGAEFFVLVGARNFIRSHQPYLLLSIHPNILPVFGHSVATVRDFLTELNYEHEVVAIDHEEHWFCKPSKKIA